MYRTGNKLLPAIFFLFWAPLCFAEQADRNEPMHLEADQVIMDDARQTSTFVGNVRLSQGTLLIKGDKIIMMQDKEGYKHATAYGNSAEFRQKRDGAGGYVEGYGEKIEYDTRTETLDFYINAKLKRNQDEVSGSHITYNARTEIFQVNGNSDANGVSKSSQRVRAILQPIGQDNKPQAESAAPSENTAPGK